ncbi:MAG: MMPL family transporter, partial [Myxococcota bacterium]
KLLPPVMADLVPIAFLAPTADDARALKKKLLQLRKQHPKKITDVLSLFTFLPEQQQAKLKVLRDIQTLLKKNDVESFLEDKQQKPFQDLKRWLNTSAFDASDLPAWLRQDLVTPNKKFLVLVTSQLDQRDGRNTIAIMRLLAPTKTPNHTYFPAGVSMLYALLLTTITRDGLWALLLSFLIIGVLLWLEFRRWDVWLLGMIPLLLGMSWMLGICVLFGFKLSFINIAALPVLLGIGIDNGIHLLHRYLERAEHGIHNVWQEMRGPIAMATLTSVLGFVGMVIGSHKGLRGLGILASIGLCTCLLASLLVLPACIEVFAYYSSQFPSPARAQAQTSSNPTETADS